MKIPFGADNCLIEFGEPISKAFELINWNRGRNIYVVDKGTFRGAVSDGDLRRAILNGASLSDGVEVATNFNSTFVTLENSNEEVNRMFNDDFDSLPILDSSNKVIRILKRGEKLNVPLSEPNLGNREIELVLNTLLTNMISSTGSYVARFEKMFADYIGVDERKVIAVSNGTQALYIALNTLGIAAGDEVIVPDLTFGATANAVIQAGATPVFIDIDAKSWNLDPSQIEKAISPKTKAIIPVHLYGNPANILEINEIANLNGLLVIEDAAEALGSYFQDLHVGVTSNASTFSFFGNKTITTGEGGIVVFKDVINAEKARNFKNHGMSPQKRYFHESWGSNFRLTNIQAAIGCAQLERISYFVQKKIEINIEYRNKLEKLGCIFSKTVNSSINSHWLTAILLPASLSVSSCVEFLSLNGIESRSFFYPLHDQPAFESFPNYLGKHSISKQVFERGICLPSATTLTEADIQYVCSKLAEFLEMRNN